MKIQRQETACWNRMGENYEALCNQGGPCKAERSLMSWCVTAELQGCTANQPPRRGMKRRLTQVLHHHAGRNAISRPVVFTSPTPNWLLNQHASQSGKRRMESEVAGGCNHKLSHTRCNSKFIRTLSRWAARRAASGLGWMVNGRAAAEIWLFDLISQKHGGAAWCLLLPSVLSRRVVSEVANAKGSTWNLKADVQERISMANFCCLPELGPARRAIHFTAPADCPLRFLRTWRRGEREHIPLEKETTPCVVTSLILLHAGNKERAHQKSISDN